MYIGLLRCSPGSGAAITITDGKFSWVATDGDEPEEGQTTSIFRGLSRVQISIERVKCHLNFHCHLRSKTIIRFFSFDVLLPKEVLNCVFIVPA